MYIFGSVGDFSCTMRNMRNKGLKVLFQANGIFIFGTSLLGPLYAVYVERIVSTPVAISASSAAFLIASTLFTLLIAQFGDRMREKEYLLMAGFLVRAIAWLAYIFVANMPMLLFVQVLLGLGEALGSPSFNALFARHLDHGETVRDYSSWSIFHSLISAVGVVAGGFIATYFGFVPVFIIMAAFALISFFFVLLQPRKIL